ncbi:hypothetical protein DN752_10010 [Echinicola strongylocentroti]|uniref:Uncharacterized protein n=1 Tax=Echinicola strongylocentroti TaxID=1795355 RepID=A0A2Z4II66_9BACT|nr:hypothetical protein [Echinicola strongylocentroti]AWW30429.1 hypothetical protein DN752_10010 [Echinicola strongylocentroti]
MSLSEEKEWIKKEVDNIQDESIIAAIRNIIDVTLKKEDLFSTLPEEEIIARAKKSEEEINNNETIALETLTKASKKW